MSERWDDALRPLVDEATLTPAQAARVAAVLGTTVGPPVPRGAAPQARRRSLLAEVAGYLGGALGLAGLFLVVFQLWEELPAAGQAVLAFGLTGLLLGGAVVVVRGASSAESEGDTDGARDVTGARGRLASTLAALGALCAGLAVVAVTGFADADDDFPSWRFLATAAVVAVVAGGAYAWIRRAPLLVVAWVATGAIAIDVAARFEDRFDVNDVLLATLVPVGFGAAWVALGMVGLVRERGLAGALGAGTAAVGAEIAATSGEWALLGLLLGAAVAGGCLAAYTWSRLWTYLAVGVLSALVVPATALVVLFDSTMAVAVSLLVVGALFVAGGTVALRRRRSATA